MTSPSLADYFGRCTKSCAARSVLAVAVETNELTADHLEALRTHVGEFDLSSTGKCGEIIQAAMSERFASAEPSRTATEPSTAALCYCVPMQVFTPLWTNWCSLEGEYIGSSINGYLSETVLMSAPMEQREDCLRWSAPSRYVLELFERRKGPASIHFGKALCRNREYSLDIASCPVESEGDSDELCHVRLILKYIGTHTPDVVVVEFHGSCMTPVHHDFKQRTFVSELLAWPQKDLFAVLKARVETGETVVMEAKLGLF